MTADLWPMIHAERRRLVAALDDLDDQQWRTRSLATEWTVEDVVAHLTAGALTGTAAWIASMMRARFDAAKHNQRLRAKHLGATPGETLGNLRAATDRTVTPTKHLAAMLGEVIVHGQDIAVPLDIALTPDPEAVVGVAHFFAARDFAVNSRTLVRGLRLQATDSAFTAGDGPGVRGPTLDLVMTLAGRPVANLDGPGADELLARIERARPRA